jgi:Divergent InlB B-repeat domain
MATLAGARGAVGFGMLAAALASGAACSGGGSGQARVAPQPPNAQFKLSVAVAGYGTVTDAAQLSCTNDCAAEYGQNATVTLRAVPAGSQTFAGWTGDCTGTGACTLAVTRDLHVGARFDPLLRKLSVSIQGQGTVSSTPLGISCPGTCSATFAPGTPVTLSATPLAGMTFTGWSGACTGAAGCQVTLAADAVLTAVFDVPPPPPVPRQLTVSVQGQGVVTSAPAGITCPGTCTASFASGTAVTLSASPGAGWQFSGWSGACNLATGCQFVLATDSAVVATFTVLPPPPPPPPPSSFLVTVTLQGTGTVASTPAGISCPGTCSASFAAGTSLTLSATAGTGSVFSSWSGVCATSAAGCTITLTSDSAATATFANAAPAPTRLLTVGVQGTGTITSSPAGISCSGGAGTCSAAFATGAAVALKAAPDPGAAFSGWSGACAAAYDCKVVLANDSTVGAAFAAAPPFVPTDWTFYGAQQGVPSQVLGVSADAGGNLWVAGGEEGLFVLRAGATTFQRFTMADGLRPYGYMLDGSAPPGTPYLKVLSVAGGPAGTAFVGYAGKSPPPGSLQKDCESNWDEQEGLTPDPSIYKSGDADKVTLIGNGISVVHYDIFSGPNVVVAEPRGREKLCNVLRIVYDPAQDAVWFGANHGFALGRASFQGNPTCNGQLGCTGVFEHVHPAINAWPGNTATGNLQVLTGDYYGVAIDPVTHDTWFGGANRSTKFHYATTGRNYWTADTLTSGSQYISNRFDVWPDKVGEPNYPTRLDRVDDAVSGIAGMQDGTAWVGSFAWGLAHLDGTGQVLGYVKDQLMFGNVGAVAADTFTPMGQTQSMWTGLRWIGGLARIAGGTVTKFSYGALGTLADSPVRDIQMQGTGPSRSVLIAFENGVVGVYSGP